MKIACVGNMNNALFPIARILADHGHSVTLFLLDEYDHFLPSADVFTPDTRIEIIHLGWHHQNFYKFSGKKIREIFIGFEFFIATSYAPAYFLKAGLKIDLFFIAGGDVFDYPFRKIKFKGLLPEIYQIESWRCTKFQKWGLSLVRRISLDRPPVELESYIVKLNMDKIDRVPALPFLYMKQYSPEYFKQSSYYDFIKKLRSNNDFLIVQHCRQSWTCSAEDMHYKGNEKLIRGFNMFNMSKPDIRKKLILFEYGEDVNASRELIHQLGIGELVIWMPMMLRKDLLSIIKYCDVGVGELGRSWFSYGAVYEIIAMGINFIGKRDDDFFKEHYEKLYPMYSVNNEQEVCMALADIYNNPKKAKDMAKNAYEWFMTYAINNATNKVLAGLNKRPNIRFAPTIQIQKIGVSIVSNIVRKLNIVQLFYKKVVGA